MEHSKMPLHRAAMAGDVATMKLLLASVDVNATDDDKRTPLHWAVMTTQTEAIDILMAHGADPFATDADGQMPLHVARGNVLPTLLSHVCGFCKCRELHGTNPAQINAADPWGQTPLQLSRIAPFVEFCERHSEAPVPCVNVVDCDGSTVVDCAFGHPLKVVLQLHLDLDILKVEASEGHKLSRIQTHVLRHLLRDLNINYDDLPPIVDKWEDFVFGSVIKGNIGGICTFPCNHAHDPQEVEDILSKKGDPEGLCRRLMDSSMGRCDMESEESMSVTAEVESFLTDLSSFFQQQCPLLQFQWKRVGSSVEDTKTGHPDEFDALMYFTELSKYLEVVHDRKINWIDARMKQEIAQWYPHKEITVGVKVKIFQLITDFIAENKSWGKLSFRCLKQFLCGFSAVLHLQNSDSNFNIKVDLVPLLRHGDKWYVFDGVADSPYVVDRVSESFALWELAHMRSMPSNALEGYVMAKSLRNVHLLSCMINKPILCDLVDHVLPSHVLKHALFHAFDEEKGSLKPHEWARRIYVQMKNEGLRNFFSHHGLFSHFDSTYPRQEHLNLFIQSRRPDLQAFPTEMEEYGYRQLFIDEILKILN